MQRIRRLWLLLAIYLLGALTYSISLKLLLVIVTPLSILLLMNHDEVSYQKNMRMKRGN
ncbi:hypothetical protein [Vagococcus fluvialis]|uniref:hypothetical protein n=1 Tax=Vagococcus fluvialis TaxID=2738 RepID=UPI00143302CD|nr:hypothetical protein [Vagococcus fluvialis]NKC58918.1 hypothetical protein [Vagococcus fluvialis]NKD49673.1 hypothetical protein [Vagococcus fluvialis]WNF89832.1 hypothetical protein QDW48_11960 [Vagococcus fluvialis]